MKRRVGAKVRNRRGTILIMAVALLVLLALIGTAWIATVSVDREASKSNIVSTHAQLALEGMEEAVKGTVGKGDLSGRYVGGSLISLYRPRSDTYVPAVDNSGNGFPPNNVVRVFDYAPWTCPIASPNDRVEILERQQWLASRAQMELETNGGVPIQAPFWPAISAPPVAAASSGYYAELAQTVQDTALTVPQTNVPLSMLLSANEFESPYRADKQSADYVNLNNLSVLPSAPLANDPVVLRYRQRQFVQPTSIRLSVGGVQKDFPAFQITYRTTSGQTATTKVLAADTDGDGIADAGLFPLPGGQQDGVTWYAAVRIIDDNSAANLNTAWEWFKSQTNPPPNQPPSPLMATSFFPTNVSLTDFLGQNDLDRLNAIRFNGLNPLPLVVTDDVTHQRLNNASFISQYDALWHQLGRRIENPGWFIQPQGNGNAVQAQPIPLSAQLSLAYHFISMNPAGISYLETQLSSLQSGLDSYSPANYQAWFDANFSALSSGSYNRRCLLVARNPVSIQTSPAIPYNEATVLNYFQTAYGGVPVKVSLNTAPFNDLWLGFWNVMVDRPWYFNPISPAGAVVDITPFWRENSNAGPQAVMDPYRGMKWTAGANGQLDTADTAAPQNTARQFRSIIRDFQAAANKQNLRYRLSPGQMLTLRAAIAANNAIQLRIRTAWNIQAPPPIARRFPVSAAKFYVSQGPGLNGIAAADMWIYGAVPQPFIAEVYADNDDTDHNSPQRNSRGYFAIELYNPYTFAIQLDNWKVALYPRNNWEAPAPTMPMQQPQSQDVVTLPAGTVIDAKGFLIIDNYGNGDALRRPKLIQDAITKSNGALKVASVPGIGQNGWYDRELVILRPAADLNNPGVAVTDEKIIPFAPVEQFDFSGLRRAQGPDKTAWHYARNTTDPFKCVYPGRYYMDMLAVGSPTPSLQPRQQGTKVVQNWNPAQTPEAPLNPPATFGAATTATYESPFTIQIANDGSPGPNVPNQMRFPFGGFARNGDVQQVPFISACRILRPGNGNDPSKWQIYELNSLPMDAAFAEDSDPNDNASECIGRFCPILDRLQGAGGIVDDFNANDSTQWRYRWATKVLDYLTVQAPYDDFVPNATHETLAAMYGAYRNNQSLNVANADTNHRNMMTLLGAVDDFEKTLGVDGLININTAPWRVLAALPMAVNVDGSIDGGTNTNIAKGIAYYRDVFDPLTQFPHGPFKSIFELYRVPEVRVYINSMSRPSNVAQGNITPAGSSDGISDRNDFENQFVFLTRISNLITTRSDTFTCYVLVQGWRNAGSSDPLGLVDPTKRLELVAERRAAFVVDRSRMIPPVGSYLQAPAAHGTPMVSGLTVTPIPNE